DPDRTSPTANRPGTLASSGAGEWPSGPCAAACPVRTNPCASSATSRPRSHLVSGYGPDEDEHVAYVGFLLGASSFVAPRNRLQPGSLITVEPRELAVGMKLDYGGRRNAIDQIARHRRRETFTAYQHVHSHRDRPASARGEL